MTKITHTARRCVCCSYNTKHQQRARIVAAPPTGQSSLLHHPSVCPGLKI